MQQVGGSLGLAVLVTVFGTAARKTPRPRRAGLSPAEAARHVFVVAADRVLDGAGFLAATWLLVAFLLRPRHEVLDADALLVDGPELALADEPSSMITRAPPPDVVQRVITSVGRAVLGAEAEHRVVPDLARWPARAPSGSRR